MKKILRSLFSRFSLISIGVILQIISIYLFFHYLEEDFFVAQIIIKIFSWIVIATIPFRTMPPEGKVTWVFIILAVPLFGSILYLMFSKNLMSSRSMRMHKRLEIRKDLYNFKNENYNEKMTKVVGNKYFGQMEYIYSCNHQIGFTNTTTKFFPSGEKYFEELKKDLLNANKFVFMEFFIIEPGVFLDSILEILKEKIKQGVEVRLIIDDIGCIQKLPHGYTKYLKKLGIKLVVFNRFIPIASAVHNNRDHRKIIVIDGEIGYTGGINIADEYINVTHPYKHWKDSGIKLIGPAVDELTILFLSNYDLQKMKMDDIEQYLYLAKEQESEGVVVPYADGPRPAYLEYVGENVYLNMINQAEKYIYITTPYLIIDNKIKTALESAAKRGVDVRIVTPHVPDKKLIFMITRSSYAKLQKSGVKIFEYKPGFIHAKQVLCDDEVGIVGTINFDYRSLLHHYENAVWIYKTSAIDEIKVDFNNIFDVSINMYKYKQNWFLHFICKIGEVFQPLL